MVRPRNGFETGSIDATAIELNGNATQVMPVETRLEFVPGATQLFEEPGALERVARLARERFLRRPGPYQPRGPLNT